LNEFMGERPASPHCICGDADCPHTFARPASPERQVGQPPQIAELLAGDGLYYVAQERAFAPGISGGTDAWPAVLTSPKVKHGRLVKRVLSAEDRAYLRAARGGRPAGEPPDDEWCGCKAYEEDGDCEHAVAARAASSGSAGPAEPSDFDEPTRVEVHGRIQVTAKYASLPEPDFPQSAGPAEPDWRAELATFWDGWCAGDGRVTIGELLDLARAAKVALRDQPDAPSPEQGAR
jgi:hypothetical protein